LFISTIHLISISDKLIILLTGQYSDANWHHEDRQTDFYDLRRMVDELVLRMGAKAYKISEIKDLRWSYGLSYARGKDKIVSFGQVDEEIVAKMDISLPVFYAEFELDMLYQIARQSKLKIKSVSKYPTIRRDLALVIDDNCDFGQIETITKNASKNLIKEVGLFDVYKNDKQLGKGKKSYAINIIFENKEKTLEDKEVDQVMDKLIAQLKDTVKAEIR